jgi:carboxyl-terminal processing protease
MRLRFLFMWVTPLVLGSTLVGLLTARTMYARENRTYWNDSIEERVRLLVGADYVDEISDERGRELFFIAMKSYVRALDPYCAFYDPDERQAMEVDTRGQFGGIGITVGVTGEDIVITGIRRGDPAERAGVAIGDHILAVDGVPTTGKEVGDLTHLIRGHPGQPVTLTLLRGEEKIDRELIRSEVKIDSVVGSRIIDQEQGIGYFRVNSFQENTGTQAREAIQYLKELGARSYVLDLRQNTGGVLERGAVGLADLFLSDGPIVQTKGRTDGSKRIYKARPETTLLPTEPVVVLVDGGSASAAEVVAGAFQDRRRGVLVGERTYGKFLVQSIHRLPELDVAVQITTARYYTPYGRWLQRNDDKGIRGGLLPDIVVARSKEETLTLFRDLMPAQHGLEMIVAEPPAPNLDLDPQLKRAVQLLREYAVLSREED